MAAPYPYPNPNLGPGSHLPHGGPPEGGPQGTNPGPEAEGRFNHPFVRPLSPWAERYGVVRDGCLHHLDEFRHSTYAPEYPSLDPRYYADDPDPTQVFHGFARGLHEDRLFYSEKNQNSELRIDTWQVGPLNRYVSFGPRFPKILGGHNKVWNESDDPFSVIDALHRLTGVRYAAYNDALMGVFHFERIKVDESKWFRFFRRSRWWNPEAGHDPVLDLHWSVDNPKVWAQISIILELANRILNALVDDEHEWLRTVLFGRLDYWRNVRTDPPRGIARVLLSREADRLVCRAKGTQSFFDIDQELPDWRFRLESLLARARWTFKDDPDSAIMGVTDPSLSCLIALDVHALRQLCGDKLTLSERCLITLMTTNTVLHELMHHINHMRMTYDPPEMNNFLTIKDDPQEELEPFVDYDGEAELGHAFEKAVWGGIMEDSPQFGMPITLKYHSWPGFRGTPPMRLNLKHPVFSTTHMFKTWRIPSTWASTMLSSWFWDNPAVPRKSDNAFHLAPLFVSYARNEEYEPPLYDAVHVDRNIAYASDLEQELIREWDERTELWDNFRQDWFDIALDRWWTTPWCETDLRQFLNSFTSHFKDHDALQCAVDAKALVECLPWNDSPTAFREMLPPHDNFAWIFSAIGLLMLASCPMRTSVLDKEPSEYVLLNGGRVKPSVMAQGVDIEVIERSRVTNYTDGISVEPPLVANPFRGIPSSYPSSQLGYLNMVTDLIENFGRHRNTVSGPWLQEIIRAVGLLQEERERLRGEYPKNHETKWAYSWDFQQPEYVSSTTAVGPQPGLWTRWDPDTHKWVDAELEPPPVNPPQEDLPE